MVEMSRKDIRRCRLWHGILRVRGDVWIYESCPCEAWWMRSPEEENVVSETNSFSLYIDI